MKPTTFKEQTIVFAKDQPQYQPLPAFVKDYSPKGEVVSCWKLSWKERFILLFSGRIWLELLMFKDENGKVNPLTPSYLTVKKSDVIPYHFNYGKAASPKPNGIDAIKAGIKKTREANPNMEDLVVVVHDDIYNRITSGILEQSNGTGKIGSKLFVDNTLVVALSKVANIIKLPKLSQDFKSDEFLICEGKHLPNL